MCDSFLTYLPGSVSTIVSLVTSSSHHVQYVRLVRYYYYGYYYFVRGVLEEMFVVVYFVCEVIGFL